MWFAHALDVQALQRNIGTKQVLIQGHVEVSIEHLELALDTCLLYFRKVHLEQLVEPPLNDVLLLLWRQRQDLRVRLVLVVIISVLLVEVSLRQLLDLVGHFDLSRLLEVAALLRRRLGA